MELASMSRATLITAVAVAMPAPARHVIMASAVRLAKPASAAVPVLISAPIPTTAASAAINAMAALAQGVNANPLCWLQVKALPRASPPMARMSIGLIWELLQIALMMGQ